MAVQTYQCTRGPWWSFISLQRDTALMLAGLTADCIRRCRSNELMSALQGHLKSCVTW